MTIEQIKAAFSPDTEIYILSYEQESPKLQVSNFLLGYKSFRNIEQLGRIKALEENKLEIKVDMPICILDAWIKFDTEKSYPIGSIGESLKAKTIK